MRRAFPICIGFLSFSGNLFRFVPDLFRKQVLKGFIVGKLSRMFLFGGSFLSSRHLGDLPC